MVVMITSITNTRNLHLQIRHFELSTDNLLVSVGFVNQLEDNLCPAGSVAEPDSILKNTTVSSLGQALSFKLNSGFKLKIRLFGPKTKTPCVLKPKSASTTEPARKHIFKLN